MQEQAKENVGERNRADRMNRVVFMETTIARNQRIGNTQI